VLVARLAAHRASLETLERCKRQPAPDFTKPHSYQYGPATSGAACDCGRVVTHAIHGPADAYTRAMHQWWILISEDQRREIVEGISGCWTYGAVAMAQRLPEEAQAKVRAAYAENVTRAAELEAQHPETRRSFDDMGDNDSRREG